MSHDEELYGKFENMQQKINELLILSENLNNNYQKILEQLDLSDQQLTSFVENPENFSEKEWEDLEAEKKKMQEMLDLQMSHLQDPKKVQKKYSQRKRVKSNWLFVR